jgi:hypothetical protein
MKQIIFETTIEEEIINTINSIIEEKQLSVFQIDEEVFFNKSNIRTYRIYLMCYQKITKIIFVGSRERLIKKFNTNIIIEEDNLISWNNQAYFEKPDDKKDKKTPFKHMRFVIIYYKKNEQ